MGTDRAWRSRRGCHSPWLYKRDELVVKDVCEEYVGASAQFVVTAIEQWVPAFPVHKM